MLRTAIVGLGSWGKTLVSSVQGKSGDIRFTSGCTRTPATAEMFCREQGIHLAGSFVEKPFTLTSAGARTAIDAVRRARVTLAVGLNRRFHPSMQELQRRVKSGKLGVIGSVLAELTATTVMRRNHPEENT